MSHKLLKGKTGIIFGALNEYSLAWQVALRCHEEGAKIVLTNNRIAMRLGELQKLAARVKAPVICADVSDNAQLETLITESLSHFGQKIDFVLHSVGMSFNIRKKHHYTELNHDLQHKTLDVSAISLHRFLQLAYKHDALNSWGSVVALSFVAAQRVFPDYNEMADAKVLLESIVRNFGYHYGFKNKVRINSVSQSPTATSAGTAVKNFSRFSNFTERMSPLGNAPAKALADFCVMLFSDYSRYITMQNIFHDGGFSATGISERIAKQSNIQKDNDGSQ